MDRQAAGIQCEEVCIPDAELFVVKDTNRDKFRLIIASRNGCSILSQDCESSIPHFYLSRQ